jgi:phosphatidylserine decarboxylase
VKVQDKFWLKGQPYSLNDMLNFDPSAKLFEGGTVYQAFLSALSFHRWNSPVKGKIAKAFVVNGSYYLQSL